MSDPLGELQRWLPPPTSPRFAQGDWAVVENHLGTRLPSDYKEFISIYGSGSIASFLFVNNLLESSRNALGDLAHLRHVQETVFGELKHVAGLMKRPPESVSPPVPFPIHPDPEGLFPWGVAQDGWTFWWSRKGEPQCWDVVVLENWIEKHYHFTGKSMVQFLVDLFFRPFDKRLKLSPNFDAA